MTMTDPKQDVRQQFEAWAVKENYYVDRMPSRPDEYKSFRTHDALVGYQAALQSPAVRELVEAAKQAIHAIEDGESRQSDEFDAADRLEAALRTLGAGHVE